MSTPKSRHQDCSDQSQQCHIFEGHAVSMNVARVSRNFAPALGLLSIRKATNGLVSFELRTALVCREKLKDR
jgi:hypothetical protein